MAYRHLYLVVSSYNPQVVGEGELLLWRHLGGFYTIRTVDMESWDVKPLANITLLKTLTEGELACLFEEHNLCKCVPNFETLLDEALDRARQYFRHLDPDKAKAIRSIALRRGGCGKG